MQIEAAVSSTTIINRWNTNAGYMALWPVSTKEFPLNSNNYLLALFTSRFCPFREMCTDWIEDRVRQDRIFKILSNIYVHSLVFIELFLNNQIYVCYCRRCQGYFWEWNHQFNSFLGKSSNIFFFTGNNWFN